MNLFYNESSTTPECLLRGSISDLSSLGETLKSIDSEFFVESKACELCKAYKSTLDGINFQVDADISDKLAMDIKERTLILSGSRLAIQNFGQGLINIFDATAHSGTHIHYDYLDGHGLTRETNISLVISCDA